MEFLSPSKTERRKQLERAERLWDLLPEKPDGGDRPSLSDSPEKLSDKYEGLIVEAIAQSDARADNAAVVVQTIADLRVLDVTLIPSGALILVSGYYAAGDGGGGLFRLDKSDTSTADDGGATIALASGPRAKAVWADRAEIPALRFGVKTDFALLSWTGTDNTERLQAAINYAEAQSSNGTPTVVLPVGSMGIKTVRLKYASLRGTGAGTNTAYRTTTLCHMSGATEDMIDMDIWSGSAYVQPQAQSFVENILFIGSRERNLKNPKTIVSASSRNVFFVAPSDVPSAPSDVSAWPYYGVAMIFSSENRFVGHAVIQSVNAGTGQINIATGYDNYATLTGASGLLTPGWRVCFATSGTQGNNPANRLDNTGGGYAAIKILGSGFRRIRDCNFISWHVGIRLGSCIGIETQNLWAYGCSLSLMAQAWLDSGADDQHIRYYNQGTYFPDYGLAAESLSITDIEYRRCAFGLFGLRSRAQYSQTTSDSCVHGLVQYSGFQQIFSQTLIDVALKAAVLSINGSSLSTGIQFNDLQISAYRNGYTLPTYITYPGGSRDAIVAVGTSWTNSIVIGSLSVIRWPSASSANDWANLVYATGVNTVRIAQFIPGTGYTAISSAGNYPLIGSVSGGVDTAALARWGVVKTSDTVTGLASNGSVGLAVSTPSVGANPVVGIRNPAPTLGHVDTLGFTFAYGADSGSNATRTDTTAKAARFTSVPYTLSQSLVTFAACFNDSAGNVIQYGGSVSDQQAVTDHRFFAAAAQNTLSGTFVARINTGGMVLGPSGISGNIDASLLWEPRSTTKGALVGPKMTTSQADAIASPVSGLGVYDTTANKHRVYDGTRFRYNEMYLSGQVTWDIPSTSPGGEQTTTLNITGAAVGDLVLVTPSRIAQSFLVVGVVQSAGVVSLYAVNSGASIVDPVSQTYTVHVLKP